MATPTSGHVITMAVLCACASPTPTTQPPYLLAGEDAETFEPAMHAGYRSYVQARKIAIECARALGMRDGDSVLPDMRVTYLGRFEYRGDWSSPHSRRVSDLRGAWLHSDRLRACVVDEHSVGPGDKRLRTHSIACGASSLSFDYLPLDAEAAPDPATAPWDRWRPRGTDDADAFALTRMPWPHATVREATHAASLRWLDTTTCNGETCDVLSLGRDGEAIELLIRRRDHLPARIASVQPSPHRPDRTVWVDFSDYRDVAGFAVPTRRRETRSSASRMARIEHDLDLPEPTEVEPSVFDVPEPARDRVTDWAVPAEPAPSDALPQPQEIAPGVFTLDLPSGDCQTMFVTMADHVIAFEAPVDDALSGKVLAAIAAAVPDKPLRYVVVSHHHGHYVGGVRAFAEAGCEIVTTPGNAELVRSVATWPRQGRHSTAIPELLVVRDRHVFEDATHRIEVHDLGPNAHTDEYLISYLPRAKLVFEGDLGTFPLDGSPDPDPWSQALLAGIERLGLDVDRIVQCWPRRDQKHVASFADLEAVGRTR